jgi:hypothetical protein
MAPASFPMPDGTKLFLLSKSSGSGTEWSDSHRSPWTVVTNRPKHELRADDALNYEQISAACKIPGSIRSDCYKAQVAGTSSLPRCHYASGPRAVALYRDARGGVRTGSASRARDGH